MENPQENADLKPTWEPKIGARYRNVREGVEAILLEYDESNKKCVLRIVSNASAMFLGNRLEVYTDDFTPDRYVLIV